MSDGQNIWFLESSETHENAIQTPISKVKGKIYKMNDYHDIFSENVEKIRASKLLNWLYVPFLVSPETQGYGV